MKIAVVSDEHFPHTGADTEVIVNTAAAMGAAGAKVTLVVPFLWKTGRLEEICAFYGVKPTFELHQVFGWPAPSHAVRVEKLFHGPLSVASSPVRNADVVHSRDLFPIIGCAAAGIPWSFETYRRHAEEKPWLAPLTHKLHLEKGVGAVAHSNSNRKDLIQLGFPEDAVVTARPGFALSRFQPALSKEEARSRLGLQVKGPIVGYTGNIHASKGVEQLLDVAALLPEVTFLVVGGTPEDVDAVKAEAKQKGAENVLLVGHKRPADVPPYLFACDVLFAPHIASNVRSGFLSELLAEKVLPGTPLKFYGYLASGRPIVAAEQPTNRELLREDVDTLFFPPGQHDVAAAQVRRLVSDPALAARLGASGREFANELTWDARAKTMLTFFERRLRTSGRG